MPKRIQRKRTKGWRMPKGAVYVGRPTGFGNDWTMRDAAIRGVVGAEAQRAWAIEAYRSDVRGSWDMPGTRWHRDEIATLRGKDLACWCPLNKPCHADVLLELANASDARLTDLESGKANGSADPSSDLSSRDRLKDQIAQRNETQC